MVWAKLFAFVLGHEIGATVAVVTGVFLGLLLGSWLHPWFIRSKNPARCYALCEWWMAAALLLTLPCIRALEHLPIDASRSGMLKVLAWILPSAILLPVTVPMGATLPFMEKWVATVRASRREIGWVLGWNTLGASLGCWLAISTLVPALGLNGTLVLLAGLSFIAGTLAWAQRKRVGNTSPAPQKDFIKSSDFSPALLPSLFATGVLGIGLEIAGVRAMSVVTENTVYSFAMALSVYLLFSASGSFLRHRIHRAIHTAYWFAGLACATAFSAAAITILHPLAFNWRARWGVDLVSQWLLEWCMAALVLGVPSLMMGWLSAELLQAARSHYRGVGLGLSANLLGCIIAGPIVGLYLIPSLGFRWTWFCLAAGYAAFTLGKRPVACVFGLVGLTIVCFLPNDLRLLSVPNDSRVLAQRPGSIAMVTVLEGPGGNRSLRVNNRFQMGGNSVLIPQRRQALIPLLLHPSPKNALFIGTGTGITLGAAASFPGLKAEGVELVPEIIQMMDFFEPANRGVHHRSDVILHRADAVSFVRHSSRQFDVIVADLFHPAQDGASILYSQEHFQTMRSKLLPGGLLCQWLPIHQMDEATLKLVMRTFQSVFSHTEAWLLHLNIDIPVIGLIGYPDEPVLRWNELETRLAVYNSADLKSAGLARPWDLLGNWLAGPDRVRDWASGAAINTANFPYINYTAAAGLARLNGKQQPVLFHLLNQVQSSNGVNSASFLKGQDSGYATLMSAYLSAREHYFAGLRWENEGDLAQAMTDYFAGIEQSLYFTPAYARMVSIIQVMATADPQQARLLYERLLSIRPDQPLGKNLLSPLFQTAP